MKLFYFIKFSIFNFFRYIQKNKSSNNFKMFTAMPIINIETDYNKINNFLLSDFDVINLSKIAELHTLFIYSYFNAVIFIVVVAYWFYTALNNKKFFYFISIFTFVCVIYATFTYFKIIDVTIKFGSIKSIIDIVLSTSYYCYSNYNSIANLNYSFSVSWNSFFIFTILHMLYAYISISIFNENKKVIKISDKIEYFKKVFYRRELYYFPIQYFTFIILTVCLFTNDGTTFFVAIECYSVLIYFIIGINSFDTNFFIKKFIYGRILISTRYLIISLISTLFITLGWGFFMQAWGSIKFSRPSIMLTVSPEGIDLFTGSYATWSFFCIIIAMTIKIGIAPFNFWAPSIYSELDNKLFIFIQGVSSPIIILFIGETLIKTKIIIFEEAQMFIQGFAIINMFIGTFGAIFQRNIKIILFYSSIANTGQIILIISTFSNYNFMQTENFYAYHCIYSVINIIFIVTIYKNIFFFTKKWNFELMQTMEKSKKILISTALVNIAGLPPFGLFWPKIEILINLIKENNWIAASFIALSSVIAVGYVYPVFSSVWNRNKLIHKEKNWNNTIIFSYIFISVFGYVIFTIFDAYQKKKIVASTFINFFYNVINLKSYNKAIEIAREEHDRVVNIEKAILKNYKFGDYNNWYGEIFRPYDNEIALDFYHLERSPFGEKTDVSIDDVRMLTTEEVYKYVVNRSNYENEYVTSELYRTINMLTNNINEIFPIWIQKNIIVYHVVVKIIQNFEYNCNNSVSIIKLTFFFTVFTFITFFFMVFKKNKNIYFISFKSMFSFEKETLRYSNIYMFSIYTLAIIFINGSAIFAIDILLFFINTIFYISAIYFIFIIIWIFATKFSKKS